MKSIYLLFFTVNFVIASIDNSEMLIRENVVFEKTNEVSTTRSNWLITFAIDLNPYQDLLNKLNDSLIQNRGH